MQWAISLKLNRKLWKATRLQHHQLTMWLPGLVKAASLQHWRCLTLHPWNSEFQICFGSKFQFSASCRKEVERKLQKTRLGKGYSKWLQPEAYGCLLKWWRRDAAGEYILDSVSSNPHRSDVGKPSNQPVLGIWLIGMVAGVFAELCTASKRRILHISNCCILFLNIFDLAMF